MFCGVHAFTTIEFEYEAMQCAAKHLALTHDCAPGGEVAILMWTQTLDSVIAIAVLKNDDVRAVDRCR